MKQRLSKVIQGSGLCSRRAAEALITQGRVFLNGEVVTTLVTLVDSTDHIIVDGKPLNPPEIPKIWLYYKPVGLICSRHDPQGRPTVFDKLPFKTHIISIGRLDFNSEGLLLFTNSGALAHYCELPKTGWRRTYSVRVYGAVNPAQLDQLTQGMTVEGIHYRPMEIDIKPGGSRNTWLYLTLTEGKNQEIRKVMTHLGLQVNRLKRLSFGPFLLDTMKPGELREISLPNELNKFKILQEDTPPSEVLSSNQLKKIPRHPKRVQSTLLKRSKRVGSKKQP